MAKIIFAYSHLSCDDAGQAPLLIMLLGCRVSIEYQRKQAKAMQKYFRGRSQQVQAEKSQWAFALQLLNPRLASCSWSSRRQLLAPSTIVCRGS